MLNVFLRFRMQWLIVALLLAAMRPGFAQTSQTINYVGENSSFISGSVSGSGITLVGTANNNDDNTDHDNNGSVTPKYPTGWQPGDLLLCVIEANDDSGVSTGGDSVSMGGGWTQLLPVSGSPPANAGTNTAAVFWKIAASGDDTSPTVSHTGNSIIAGIIAFRGVDNTSPFDGTASMSSSTNSSTTVMNSITTTTPGDVEVFTVHVADDNSGVSSLSGWTNALSDDTSSGHHSMIEAWYQTVATPGTQSAQTVSRDGGNTTSNGGVLALRPATNTCVTVSEPTGIVANDVMIASVAVRPQDATLIVPSGWNLIGTTTQPTGGSNGGFLASYYKVATSSEPSSYSWCTSNTASDLAMSAGITVFSGVSTTNPINATSPTPPSSTPYLPISPFGTPTPLNNGTLSTSQIAYAITPTTSNTMLVGSYMLLSSYNWTKPSGMTEAVDQPATTSGTSNGGVSLGMDYERQAAARSTGNKTAKAGHADNGATQLIALWPALITSNPGAFNAFESSTPDTATSGNIYTKMARQPFTLDLVATEGTQLVEFPNNVSVSLVAAPTGTVTTNDGGKDCTGDYTISVASASTPAALFASTARVYGYSFAAVNTAYRDVRVLIQSFSPALKVCSSDNFAIRPANFTTVSSSNATNTATTGTPTFTAGSGQFNLTATTATPGYDGTPLISTVANMITGSSVAGSISGSFSAANSSTGVASGNAFTYSEVGNFTLAQYAVYDQSFTSVDQKSTGNECTNDYSTTSNGGMYGCYIGNVAAVGPFGRFIPDHFSVVVTPACSASGKTAFTYSGQPFTATVTALNASGSTTQNYDTTAGFSQAVTLSDASGASGTWSNNVIAASMFVSGATSSTTQTTPMPTFTFTTLPSIPATLQVRATDSDNVNSSGHDGAALIRLGRLRLFNAYGAVGTTLSMPVQAQYWNSPGVWVQNSDDSCTTIAPADVYLSSGTVTASGASAMLIGMANLSLTSTASATTSSNVAINLGATGVTTTQSCLSTNGAATAAAEPWLQSQNGTTGSCTGLSSTALWQRDPSAMATFGIYTPESRRMIHMREVFW